MAASEAVDEFKEYYNGASIILPDKVTKKIEELIFATNGVHALILLSSRPSKNTMTFANVTDAFKQVELNIDRIAKIKLSLKNEFKAIAGVKD